ncbi:MAG: AmmeMemoRadiSam system radical SAM enzyme [Candidatus Altiarchaeota archaeon]
MAPRKSKNKTILDERITRRQFLMKGAAGLIGLGALSWGINKGVLRLLSGAPTSITAPFKGAAPRSLWKWSREADYWTRDGQVIQCELCPHRCRLGLDDRGACRTRVNKDGRLYTLAYGNPCSVHVDPIEKKPLYHFLPATNAFSLATAGCNLRCRFCQNWEISQATPEELRNFDVLPEDTVAGAVNARESDPQVRSIAYTYSEPTAFYEYMLDTARIARKAGIRSVVITAGYVNEKPVEELAGNVDAIKIDLKGFNEGFYRDVCGAELNGVLEAIKAVHRSGVWLELVNLVVPTLNDDLGEIRAMCEWVVDNLGRDVPLHFSRFSPQYRLLYLPRTPVQTLIDAREIALDAGINHVYIGNAETAEGNNTYCPNDKTLCIERKGFTVTKNNLVDGRCPTCRTRIAGVWK